jgi:hypothetical protein
MIVSIGVPTNIALAILISIATRRSSAIQRGDRARNALG